jgi:hypothetical protein
LRIAIPPAATQGLQQRRGIRHPCHLTLDARQARLCVLAMGDEQIDVLSAAVPELAAGYFE